MLWLNSRAARLAVGFMLCAAPAMAQTQATINKLNEEINAALADPKIKGRLVDLGGTMLVGSPADFGKLIAEETEKWGKVVKFAGVKPE